jgi:hypothetical protein
MGKIFVKDGTKKSRLGIRLPEFEHKSLELMARSEKRTVSDMLRVLIREGAVSRSIIPDGEGPGPEGVAANVN